MTKDDICIVEAGCCHCLCQGGDIGGCSLGISLIMS